MMKESKNKVREDQESTEEALERELLKAAEAVDDYMGSMDHGIIDAVLTKMIDDGFARPHILVRLIDRQRRIERKIEAIRKISKQPFMYGETVDVKEGNR